MPYLKFPIVDMKIFLLGTTIRLVVNRVPGYATGIDYVGIYNTNLRACPK